MILNKKNPTFDEINRLLKQNINGLIFFPVDDIYTIFNDSNLTNFFLENFKLLKINKIIIQYPGRIYDNNLPRFNSLNKIKFVSEHLYQLNRPVYYGSMYDYDIKYIKDQLNLNNIPLYEIYYSFIRYRNFYEFKTDEIIYDIDHGTSSLLDIKCKTADRKIRLLMSCINKLLLKNPNLKIIFSQKLKNEVTPEILNYINNSKIIIKNLEQTEYIKNIIAKSKVSITGSLSESGPRLFLFSMMFGKCTYFHELYSSINGNMVIDEFKPYQKFYNENTDELDYSKLEPMTYDKILKIMNKYV